MYVLKFLASCFAPVILYATHGNMQPKSTTILIHGTLFPIISYYYHGVSSTPGIKLAKEESQSNTLALFASVLSQASPIEFPLDSFYIFGWSGSLKSSARLQAAKELWTWLNLNHFNSLTIIGHSHGATIALLLAQLAEEFPNTTQIDKLILISCPVQDSTASYLSSPLFKKVYHLYSETDLAQIIAPQRFSYGIIPVFSERVFKPSPHLVQAQILIDNADPGHNDFLLKETFITQIPHIIRNLDNAQLADPSINHFVINIQNRKIALLPKLAQI